MKKSVKRKGMCSLRKCRHPNRITDSCPKQGEPPCIGCPDAEEIEKEGVKVFQEKFEEAMKPSSICEETEEALVLMSQRGQEQILKSIVAWLGVEDGISIPKDIFARTEGEISIEVLADTIQIKLIPNGKKNFL